jgi:DNA-directed RNA polymerase subunit RPC12/RpoP
MPNEAKESGFHCPECEHHEPDLDGLNYHHPFGPYHANSALEQPTCPECGYEVPVLL